MYAQLKELLTNYGPIRMLWFDNYWYVNRQWKNDPEHAQELYTRIRRTGLLKAELLDASLPALQYLSSVDNGTTLVSLKQPAKIDPYATVVKLIFAQLKEVGP